MSYPLAYRAPPMSPPARETYFELRLFLLHDVLRRVDDAAQEAEHEHERQGGPQLPGEGRRQRVREPLQLHPHAVRVDVGPQVVHQRQVDVAL